MKVLIVGAGFMAEEYIKVLKTMEVEVVVVGSGKENVDNLKIRYDLAHAYSGGLERNIDTLSGLGLSHAITAVPVDVSASIAEAVLEAGIGRVLLEKPAGLTVDEVQRLIDLEARNNVWVGVGYNRRFYRSVQMLVDKINEDGGANSATCQFTEWIHTIDSSSYGDDVLKKWLISNSSHVLDTLFYLIGWPVDLVTRVSHAGSIVWHPTASVFCGVGESDRGVMFTYNSNWLSQGRWGISVSTSSGTYVLQPMEELKYYAKGTVTGVALVDSESQSVLKEGLVQQVNCFLTGAVQAFATLQDQERLIKICEQIGDY